MDATTPEQAPETRPNTQEDAIHVCLSPQLVACPHARRARSRVSPVPPPHPRLRRPPGPDAGSACARARTCDCRRQHGGEAGRDLDRRRRGILRRLHVPQQHHAPDGALQRRQPDGGNALDQPRDPAGVDHYRSLHPVHRQGGAERLDLPVHPRASGGQPCDLRDGVAQHLEPAAHDRHRHLAAGIVANGGRRHGCAAHAGTYTVTLTVADAASDVSPPATTSFVVRTDTAPDARLTLSQLATPALTVKADASTSTDTDYAPIASYQFTFGDGTAAVTTTAPTATAQHTYAATGTYTVTVTATDAAGLTSAPAGASITLQTDAPPVAHVTATQMASPALTVVADGATSTDTDATPIGTYQ